MQKAREQRAKLQTNKQVQEQNDHDINSNNNNNTVDAINVKSEGTNTSVSKTT